MPMSNAVMVLHNLSVQSQSNSKYRTFSADTTPNYCTRVRRILNIQSLWHVIFLLHVVTSISHTDACPLVVEMQSIQFKEFEKHYTIVQTVGTVWRIRSMLSITATVKLQAQPIIHMQSDFMGPIHTMNCIRSVCLSVSVHPIQPCKCNCRKKYAVSSFHENVPCGKCKWQCNAVQVKKQQQTRPCRAQTLNSCSQIKNRNWIYTKMQFCRQRHKWHAITNRSIGLF